MQEKVNIWSSVVVARLPEKKTCQHKREYITPNRFRSIENIKTRISARQVTIQGRSAELKVNVETLFIMEDEQGNLLPLSRRDTIKESINLGEFFPRLEESQDLFYVAETSDFYGDAFLQGPSLIIIYSLHFMLLALRQQIVSLPPETIGQTNPAGLNPANDGRSDLLREENIKLRRQIRMYEMNLLGLKKSLQKAEAINAELQRQIGLLQQETASSKTTRETDRRQSVNTQKGDDAKIIAFDTLEERRQKTGKRIREFFINNA